MGEDQSGTGRQRYSVSEAAERLGITVEAVRGRIKRGKLDHAKESGTVYVLLDTDRTATSQTRRQPDEDQTHDQTAMLEHLETEISYLREQLDAERQARTEERRRADTVIAQLSQANAEQARTIRVIEAPEGPLATQESPQESQESPVSSPEASEGAFPRSNAGGAHGGTQGEAESAQEPRRSPWSPWWRRMFGG